MNSVGVSVGVSEYKTTGCINKCVNVERRVSLGRFVRIEMSVTRKHLQLYMTRKCFCIVWRLTAHPSFHGQGCAAGVDIALRVSALRLRRILETVASPLCRRVRVRSHLES